jgi:hypothetical protein
VPAALEAVERAYAVAWPCLRLVLASCARAHPAFAVEDAQLLDEKGSVRMQDLPREAAPSRAGLMVVAGNEVAVAPLPLPLASTCRDQKKNRVRASKQVL